MSGELEKLRDEVDGSYFRSLPDELVLKLMSYLLLLDRATFMDAYPRYQDFGKDHSLKKRTITGQEKWVDKKVLSRVLDPEGTSIEISLDSSYSHLKIDLVKDILLLMPNLTEITFNRCALMVRLNGMNWPFYVDYLDTFDKLTRCKVTVVNFEGCDCLICHKHTIGEEVLLEQCWYVFFEYYVLTNESKNHLNRATFVDTLKIRDLERLVDRSFEIWLNTENEFKMHLEDLNTGEKLTLTDVAKAVKSTTERHTDRLNNMCRYGDDFSRVVKKNLKKLSKNVFRIHKVKVLRNSKGVEEVTLTDLFDLNEIRHKLARFNLVDV